jgi:hypothetical protein
MTLSLLPSSPLWLLQQLQSLQRVPLCFLVLLTVKALARRLAQSLLVLHPANLFLDPLLLSLLLFQRLKSKGDNLRVCRHFTAQIP